MSDKDPMNRIFKLLHFIFFLSLLVLVSCGAEIKTSKMGSSENFLSTQCGCTATYSPICGTNGKDYENACIASCFKVAELKQGSCSCDKKLMVCGDDGVTYNECDAQDLISKNAITKIVKFADCSAATY